MSGSDDVAVFSVAELIDRLDLDGVTVACNDWGGAQLLVSERLDSRVSRLVLVACEAFENYPPGFTGRLLCLLAIVPGGLLVTAHVLRVRILRHLPITFGPLSKRRIPEAMFREWNARLRSDPGVRHDLRTYLTNRPTRVEMADWAERQKRFTGPVLIVWAKQDSMMPARHARELADHFTDTTLVWVDDSRTLVPIDQPQRLVDAITSFMSTPTAASSLH